MSYENELVLEEGTENVEEQTTEETVEEVVTEPEKMYTEQEFNEKLDKVLAKKIARERAKIEKEYRPYKELGDVVKAGTGFEDVTTAKDNLVDFYTKKGVSIPKRNYEYSESDMRVLASNEAREIIDAGFEEVVEEVDRLASIGVEKMTPRERLVFAELAEYRQQEGNAKELASQGVRREVIESDNFKEFSKQFNSSTPITKIYDLYSKTIDTELPAKMPSMTNGNSQQEKEYYTPEEVDRLTQKDLDNPKVFEAVRRSMMSWK